MDATGWQQFADERVLDAKALLDAGRWACAYYVAGYVVECALKACVLKYVTESGIIFDDPKFAVGCRTHNLVDLVKLAQLDEPFGIARGANPQLNNFWVTVQKWTEESRYKPWTQAQAEELYEAITNNPDGVLLWIKTRW